MRPRTSRARVYTSRPKIRAVPEAGLWKPSRVLRRVDFPAPLGPNRPMDRPVRVAFKFLRMARAPKRTSRLSNSMTGSITLIRTQSSGRLFPVTRFKQSRDRKGALDVSYGMYNANAPSRSLRSREKISIRRRNPLSHQGHNFPLALAERGTLSLAWHSRRRRRRRRGSGCFVVGHELANHGGGCMRIQPDLTGVDFADALDEQIRSGLLQDNPGGAQLHRLDEFILVVRSRQNNDASFVLRSLQPLQRTQAVEPRHLEVEKQDVGLMLLQD